MTPNKREQIAGHERIIEQYRLANRHLKYGNDAGLRAMGFTEAQIAKLKEPDLSGRIGFSPELIRRAQRKIRELKGGRNG